MRRERYIYNSIGNNQSYVHTSLRPLLATAILACRAYATGMTSVCLSVTLVDCDHTVQQNVEIGTVTALTGQVGRRCLVYLHAEVGKAGLDRRILGFRIWRYVGVWQFASSTQ